MRLLYEKGEETRLECSERGEDRRFREREDRIVLRVSSTRSKDESTEQNEVTVRNRQISNDETSTKGVD